MSDVIRLLEFLAIRSRPVSAAEYEALLEGMPADIRSAVLRRDARALTALVGGRLTMACVVFTPDDGAEESPQDAPEDPADAPAEPPGHEARAA